jgi:exodeoxyribonuclease VII small subunit
MRTRFMQAVEKLSFEEALGELESLVRRLEEGKCPLDEAVKTFERGIGLKNHCETKLKNARLKVEQILENADGTVSMKPFLTEETAA